MSAIINKAVSVAVLAFVALLGSTSAAPQLEFGPGPVVLPFNIRVDVANPIESQIAAPFLTCSGQTTHENSLAGDFYLFTLPPARGELRCGSADDKLIGAPKGVQSAVFRAFQDSESINTQFVVVDEDLQWKNSSFEGGEAKFFQRDGEVYAQFKGPEIDGCEFVTLTTVSPSVNK